MVPVELDDCAREPIHIPGSIQPHGFLFVLNATDLTVVAASANAAEVLGQPSIALIGRPLTDFLVSTTTEDLPAALQPRDGGTAISVRFRGAEQLDEWAGLAHRSDDLTLLELGPHVPAGRAETLFEQVRFAIDRIRRSSSEEQAAETLAREIRRLTGFDRVMVYRFDPEWNGEVVAEDRSADAQSYAGHSFPASDIPAQARALYTRNRFRLIPDARRAASPIVPPLLPATSQPIDLSNAMLRSVSPVHREYLANMGVIASMSVSIVRDGRLWGLIACHHPSPRLLPYRIFQACELLAQTFVWYLDTRQRAMAGDCVAAILHLQAALAAGVTDDRDYRDRLASIAPALLDLTQSQGLAICEHNAVWAFGEVPGNAQILALALWLSRTDAQCLVTDHLSERLAAAADDRDHASGIAASRLANGWLIWFRGEWSHSLTWAGEPGKLTEAGPDGGRINPRKSFASWCQQIYGRSRPWTAHDLFAIDQVRVLVLRAMMEDHTRQALQRSKLESLGEMASRMTHELNNLLQPVLTMAQMARDDHPSDLELAEEMEVILGSAGRAAEITRGMLLYVRRTSTDRRHLALGGATAKLLEDLRPTLPSGIQLDVVIEEAKCRIRVPPDELGQIVEHLVNNAVQAMADHGQVSVRVDEVAIVEAQAARMRIPAGRYGRLMVSDNGPGMAPAVLRRVFEPFFTTKEVGLGLGLGLSIVRGIARSCGGATVARNHQEGGAVFEVLLPSFDEPAEPDDFWRTTDRRREQADVTPW
jgi:light-regulated signal transduction histidine kinase (bacteriophytochrome)